MGGFRFGRVSGSGFGRVSVRVRVLYPKPARIFWQKPEPAQSQNLQSVTALVGGQNLSCNLVLSDSEPFVGKLDGKLDRKMVDDDHDNFHK